MVFTMVPGDTSIWRWKEGQKGRDESHTEEVGHEAIAQNNMTVTSQEKIATKKGLLMTQKMSGEASKAEVEGLCRFTPHPTRLTCDTVTSGCEMRQ